LSLRVLCIDDDSRLYQLLASYLGPNGVTLERLVAQVPARTFATGMAVRDEHLRRLVFTAANGDAPDLRFEADKADCASRQGSQEFTCAVAGNLTIRGIARPFQINLKVKQVGSVSFKAAGEGVVKLSDYEIPQPSQLGVKVADEVKLRLDLGAKQSAQTSAYGGKP